MCTPPPPACCSCPQECPTSPASTSQPLDTHTPPPPAPAWCSCPQECPTSPASTSQPLDTRTPPAPSASTHPMAVPRSAPLPQIVDMPPNLAVLLTHRGQLILTKISKSDATRCQILRLNALHSISAALRTSLGELTALT